MEKKFQCLTGAACFIIRAEVLMQAAWSWLQGKVFFKFWLLAKASATDPESSQVKALNGKSTACLLCVDIAWRKYASTACLQGWCCQWQMKHFAHWKISANKKNHSMYAKKWNIFALSLTTPPSQLLTSGTSAPLSWCKFLITGGDKPS